MNDQQNQQPQFDINAMLISLISPLVKQLVVAELKSVQDTLHNTSLNHAADILHINDQLEALKSDPLGEAEAERIAGRAAVLVSQQLDYQISQRLEDLVEETVAPRIDRVANEAVQRFEKEDLPVIIEEAIDDHDFDAKITSALREFDFSDEVERTLEDYDMGDKVRDTLHDNDLVRTALREICEDGGLVISLTA